MNFKNRVIAGLCAFGLMSSAAFAEGNNVIDLTTANSAMTSLKTDLTSWVTTNSPVILSILGAFLVFWLIRIGLKIVQRFGNKAS